MTDEQRSEQRAVSLQVGVDQEAGMVMLRIDVPHQGDVARFEFRYEPHKAAEIAMAIVRAAQAVGTPTPRIVVPGKNGVVSMPRILPQR